jgi:hypothetical protein
MAGGDGHAPGSDLARLEVSDRRRSEDGGGLAEQPAQLGSGLGLSVVLGEVLLDELGKSDTARPLRRCTAASSRRSASWASSAVANPPRWTRREPRPFRR